MCAAVSVGGCGESYEWHQKLTLTAAADYLAGWREILEVIYPDDHVDQSTNFVAGAMALDQAFAMQMLLPAYELVGVDADLPTVLNALGIDQSKLIAQDAAATEVTGTSGGDFNADKLLLRRVGESGDLEIIINDADGNPTGDRVVIEDDEIASGGIQHVGRTGPNRWRRRHHGRVSPGSSAHLSQDIARTSGSVDHNKYTRLLSRFAVDLCILDCAIHNRSLK